MKHSPLQDILLTCFVFITSAYLQECQAVLCNGRVADVFAAGLVLLEDLLDIQYLYNHQWESKVLMAYLAQLIT
jgi:hypothetical protein